MSVIIVAGTLILNGQLTCDGNINVISSGLVIPIPDPNTMKTYFSIPSQSHITANGEGRIITSTLSDINVDGNINGVGYGFESNRGPGCNSTLKDSSGNIIPGYGATHAGLGAVNIAPLPFPKIPYGNHETPVSLGSGSGFYHDPMWFIGMETRGGSAIRLIARSGTVSVDGTVNMSGQDSVHVGGGSGGSVWITAWNINGTGLISSSGGKATLPGSGGGGGGYISLWYERENSFNGSMLVNGNDGGTNGKTFIKQIEPIFEERFTGKIWNTKWWQTLQEPADIDNLVTLTSAQDDFRNPMVQSLFNVSGKNILANLDYIPDGTSVEHFNASFLLYSDFQNWVGLARKSGGLFGVYSVNGYNSQSAIPFDYTNVTLRLNKTDSTFAFQFFDSTSTPQTIYSEIIPELANKKFNIRMSLEKPPTSDMTRQVEYFRLTSLDESNQFVMLDGTPTDQTNVSMELLNGGPQYYGIDFYVHDNKLLWDLPGQLGTMLTRGDKMRIQYIGDMTANDIKAQFDNFKVFDGVIGNAETTEPVIYVDPDYGSDSSNGRQLSPLKNLFVATAWAKKGGTVVLYDGTHNPTSISRKNLTLMGAYGTKPIITSLNVQDSTGSGWENNALSFYAAQGVAKNLMIADSTTGIVVENSPNFEISQNVISNVSFGVKLVKCDPLISRNVFFNTIKAMDFTSCPNSYVYSNVVYYSFIATYASDCSNLIVQSNTFDNNGTGVMFSNSSSGIVASNNLTNNDVGIQITFDSTPVSSFNNNFYGSTLDYNGRAPDFTSDNIYLDPLYVGTGNYHLSAGSPDIDAGLDTYDRYFVDSDGANRSDSSTSDIGSYVFINGTHVGDYYVAGRGNDFVNFGGKYDPFRTLDKAMSIADSTIHIDGGHYDTYYLELKSQNIDLNQMTVYTEEFHHLVSYITLLPIDIHNGYVPLPGFIAGNNPDYSNVALNILTGGSQVYGIDYTTQYGSIVWMGLGLEPLLSAGDTFRILYDGTFATKAMNTFTLSPHFSNYEMEKAIFVSPNGSDSSVLGGDGTNTGGNGTFELPYRTVSRALLDSSSGSNIVVMAGEYPLFNGIDQRIIVPAIDRTSIPYKGMNQQYLEDLFSPIDFTQWNQTQLDSTQWSLSYSGDSSASIGGGFMAFTFDGTNQTRADSLFTVTNDFEISADLRNGLDPLFFTISAPDQTMSFMYDDKDYTAGAMTGGTNFYCWGTLDLPESTKDKLIVEHIGITSTDVLNKYVPLSFIPEESDCTNIAVNVVGGVPQNYWDDFIMEDSKIKWAGLGLDGEIIPGETLRVIYKDRSLSSPARVLMSLKGNRFTIKAYDTSWKTVFKRDMIGSYTGPWTVSFYMNKANAVSHDCVYGKGFVSRFTAIGDAIENSDQVKDFRIKTERRVSVFYKERT